MYSVYIETEVNRESVIMEEDPLNDGDLLSRREDELETAEGDEGQT